jgi:hypothetical protein
VTFYFIHYFICQLAMQQHKKTQREKRSHIDDDDSIILERTTTHNATLKYLPKKRTKGQPTAAQAKIKDRAD